MLPCAIFLFYLLFLFPVEVYAEGKLITIANSPWQPYYGKQLENWGMSAEIIKAALKSQGYDVVFKQMKWPRAIAQVEKGKESCIGTAYFTADRDKRFIISDSYMDSRVSFIRRKSAPDLAWENLKDFEDKVLVVVKGNSYGKAFDNAQYLKKVETVDEKISLTRHFIRGEGDYVVMDPLVAQNLLANDRFARKKIQWSKLKKPLSVNKLHLMCSRSAKGMDKVVSAFNRGLKEIKQNRTMGKILSRYRMSH